MKFVCDNCQAQYQIADDKIGPRGVKVKCKKCGTVGVVKPQSAADAAPGAATSAQAGDAPVKPALVRTSSKVQPAAMPGEAAPAPAAKGNAKSKGAMPPPPPPADPDLFGATIPGNVENPLLGAFGGMPPGGLDGETTPSAFSGDKTPTSFSPDPPGSPAAESATGAGMSGAEDAVQSSSTLSESATSVDNLAPPPVSAPIPAPTAGGGEVDAVKQLESELAGAFDGLFGGDGEETPDDRKPTKVYSPEELEQLRADPKSKANGTQPKKISVTKAPEKPVMDWYAAIRDEQQGPFSLAQMETFWSRGDVDGESLVWRAGMSDWIALKQVPELTSLLALPQPRKATSAAPPPTAPSVGSVLPSGAGLPPPADDFSEETWRPRGMTAVYQAANAAEVRQNLAAEAAKDKDKETEKAKEDELGWRPTAASALASLVSDELSTIPGKTGGSTRPPPADDDSVEQPLKNLLGGAAVAPPPPARDDSVSISRGGLVASSPFVPPAPKSGMSTGVIIGIVGGGITVAAGLLVAILAAAGLLGGKHSQQQTQVAVAHQPAPPPVQPVQPAQPAPANPQPAGTTAAAAPAPAAAPANNPEPSPKTTVNTNDSPRGDRDDRTGRRDNKRGKDRDDRDSRKDKDRDRDDSKKDESKKVDAPRPEPKEPDVVPVRQKPRDDCDPILYPEGCEDKPKKAAKPAGGGGGPETLSKADILTVVKNNKGDVARCVAEQKKKDPALGTGVVKMSWVIKNDGKTANVSVGSEEFANSYVGKCLVRAIQGWKFPAYTGEELKPIKFPFSLDQF